MEDALEAKDPIRAVIRNSGINQDGRTSGITNPNQEAQQNLIRSIYRAIDLKPQHVGYLEAHGTGTVVGDVAETKAISEVFGIPEGRNHPLYLGSVKSNIGHLESASGIAGLIKAILILEKGWIPPSINLKNLKKELNFNNTAIEVRELLHRTITDM